MARYREKQRLWEERRKVLGKWKSYYGASEEEALLKADRAQGSLALPENPSLLEFFDKAFVPTLVGKSKGYQDQVAWALDNHLYPVFGHVGVRDITRADVQNYLAYRTRGLKRSTVVTIRKVLRTILELAVDDDLIPKNPVAKTTLPKKRTSDLQPAPPDIEECRRILQQSRDTILEGVIYVALSTGLRKSEILGLQRGDFRNGQLHVDRQYIRNKMDSLKTLSSKRILAMPGGWELGLPSWSDGRNGKNEPLVIGSDATITRHIKKVSPVSLHRLRAAVATGLESLGCPRSVTAAILGHSPTSTTDIYVRVDQEVMRKWLTLWFEEIVKQPSTSG